MDINGSGGSAPIGSYGVIGDLRTTALVGADGSIDWFPFPALDSAPAFAALLDPTEGGCIVLTPTVSYRVQRRYLPDTAVLETTFLTDGATVTVTDSLNLAATGLLPWTELARRVVAEGGEVPMRWAVHPGHRLGSDQPWSHRRGGVPVVLVGDLLLAVITEHLGEPTLTTGGVEGQFVARPETPALLAVVGTQAQPVRIPSTVDIRERIEVTEQTWRRWSATVGGGGPWHAAVLRSAITLKLLIAEQGGAMAAAATTSLPEKIGGERNYDYRFAWIRDASFALDALGRLGRLEEVHHVLCWLLTAVARTSPDLHVFYTLAGEPARPEMTAAPGVAGWRDSTPVHIGNSAASQTQLGCYGDLLDAVFRYTQHGGILDGATAAMVGELADRCCDLWRRTDAGFWELGTYEHYTISKIGCWVALDRAHRLAEAGQLASTHAPRWQAEAQTIHDWVDEHCWSQAKQAYTFYADTDELDAAVLLAARTGFCAPHDPRLETTIAAVRTELGAGGSLIYRYSGQQDKEGAFLACSCWVIEALTYVGRTTEARELLEEFLDRGSDLGLYSEEMDPATGELLGNLPQALSHLALIGAATAVDRANRS